MNLREAKALAVQRHQQKWGRAAIAIKVSSCPADAPGLHGQPYGEPFLRTREVKTTSACDWSFSGSRLRLLDSLPPLEGSMPWFTPSSQNRKHHP